MLVLIVALAAMLGVTAAANSAAHFHLNSSSSRCDLCFTAHLAVETPAACPLHGPDLESRAVTLPSFFAYRTPAAQPTFSRGPPSLS